MPDHQTSLSSPPGLPLVVQLSFAGSRVLIKPMEHPEINCNDFEMLVQKKLTDRLRSLPTELGLTERHFLCGISQIAIGADTVFTRALQELNIPQRIFLPQHRDEYLAAKGTGGNTDFDPEQQQIALKLLESKHIIQERIVAESADRQTRFAEVNVELARVADVIICLVRTDSDDKPGGTLDLLEQANRRNCPVLEIRLSTDSDGIPVFTETWHHREAFALPTLPHELRGLQSDLTGVPTLTDYCKPLKEFGSKHAKARQAFFRYSAIAIIGTHFFATFCALSALVSHNRLVPWLLGIEIILLIVGFATHSFLHRRHALAEWGLSRLAAELARSVQPLASVPVYLSHFFTLPMPGSLRPLLRTLSVLQLRESHHLSPGTMPQRRDQYVLSRLDDSKSGQIGYYRRNLTLSENHLKAANWIFIAGSFGALLATIAKMVTHLWRTAHGAEQDPAILNSALGFLAILLPVVAVAALSLAASQDLEARVGTYKEMLTFLEAHRQRISQAKSEREFAQLAIEAETRLLGETVTWYFRRSYTSVA